MRHVLTMAIGVSDALRIHNADILLSQNTMTIYGDDLNRLLVPLVRPEDDSFKNLCTKNAPLEKNELKGTLDLPQQGRNSLPLKSVAIDGNHLRIEWQGRSGLAI